MSLQWTLASVFLYSEVIFVISLLIPGISPKRWLTLFNSQSVQVINRKAHLFFNFTIVVLTIFLLDAIREIYRYDAAIELEASKTSASMSAGMQPTPTREFRAQRNLYIAGMSLFLWFVIKRLVVLISNAAVLIDDYELADNECKELRRELELVKTKYDTFTAVVNSSTSTTTSTEDKAKFAEEKAEKAAEERLRSRSKSRKEE